MPPYGTSDQLPPGGPSPGGRPPQRGWGRAAKVLTIVGSALLAAAVVLAILASSTFFSLAQLRVITASGTPGPDALGGGSLPGLLEVDLKSGEVVQVWEVRHSDDPSLLDRAQTRLIAPDGDVLLLAEPASIVVQRDDYVATVVGSRTVWETGRYTVQVGDATATSSAGGYVVSAGSSMEDAVLMAIQAGGAALTFAIGVGLLIAGIVKGISGNRRGRRSPRGERHPPSGEPPTGGGTPSAAWDA